jgi:hypothetical protein
MEKWLKYLVGLSAVIIAGCAAFFSITGLGILFAGASVSVMVMAGSLEYAKLVTATYLKQKWNTIKGFNKWYLTAAVVILMAITSAGIFGYLSNAFQQQNIKLEQVAREIQVWQNKIEYSNQQITTLQNQSKDLSTTQNTLLTKGNVNSRLIKSADNRDKQTTAISKKINILQDSIVAYNGHINDIKNNNISIEREVGGFRFVAEAFGMTLNNVVKFFIFLIVIVFDPLAIALVIAFNQIVLDEKENDKNDNPIVEDENIKEVIEEESRLKLSENDLKKLEEILLNPPPPNETLKKAAETYNEEVKQKEELEKIAVLPTELVDIEEPVEENIFYVEPTLEEEEKNFSNITPISEGNLQEDVKIIEVTHNATSLDGYTPIPYGEEILEPIEDFGIPLDELNEKLNDVQSETFSEEPTKIEIPEDNERMDIIGQNGNEGLHYENEENTSSEQDDEKKKLIEFPIPTLELEVESDTSIIEDTPLPKQTLESTDSKEDNIYWETEDTNPNIIIYDLENNQTIVPQSEEEIIIPTAPVAKVISRNVSSRRRNNR